MDGNHMMITRFVIHAATLAVARVVMLVINTKVQAKSKPHASTQTLSARSTSISSGATPVSKRIRTMVTVVVGRYRWKEQGDKEEIEKIFTGWKRCGMTDFPPRTMVN